MNSQISFFDGSVQFRADKPVRLIELFAGIGSQAKALERLGIEFEHYRICEFDKYAVCAYNAIHGTAFETSDITKIKGTSLGICDTAHFCYIMTYSFPCTDLSKAGKGMGMAKGSGTRSGLLWEVERLLGELDELPQVLLMENVPDVIGTKNAQHFYLWLEKLESLGYHNYYKVLNAKDYTVPQNRERCFMVSLLGDFFYEFSEGVPLKLRLKDILEANVPEKYYISKKSAEGLMRAMQKDHKPTLIDGDAGGYSPTIDTRVGALDPSKPIHCEPHIQVIGSLKPEKAVQDRVRVLGTDGICQAIRATDYKDAPKIGMRDDR
ncbi:MAG: DNA (cytosine-5-)-methyltransferase [Bacteroides sp.]